MHLNGKHHTKDTRKTISDKNKGRYHGGSLKYTEELIAKLRQEYQELKSKRAVNKLHPDINYISLCNLINYGCSQSKNHDIHCNNYNKKRGVS